MKALFAVLAVTLLVVLAGALGDRQAGRCGQPTPMTWVYCDSVRTVR